MPTLVARQLAFSRVLIALVFFAAGMSKLLDYSTTVALLGAAGVPIPGALLPASIAIELGGSVALALGFRPRLTAMMLAAYLVPVTLLFHAFWNSTGPARQDQLVHFLKNASIIGGLLTLSFQQKVLSAFMGGTLIELRRESFDRRRAG